MPKNPEDIFDIAGMLIVGGIIVRVLSSPKLAANISASAKGFADIVNASLGKA